MLLLFNVYLCSFITNPAPIHVQLLRLTNDHAMKSGFDRPIDNIIVHLHMSGTCSDPAVLLGRLATARIVPPTSTGLRHAAHARYRAGHANICKSIPTFTKRNPEIKSDPKELNVRTAPRSNMYAPCPAVCGALLPVADANLQ